MFQIQKKWILAISTLLLSTAAQATELKLQADCSVSQSQLNSSSLSLSTQKKLSLSLGSGAEGAKEIANIQGIDLKISSPLTAATPIVVIEGKSAEQTAQAGRDIGQAQGNLVFLAVKTPTGGTVAATCVVTIQ